MDKSQFRLPELIQHFDTYNRTDGKSLATLRWYRQNLGAFLGWLIDAGRPITLGSVNENVVREYILWCQERRVHGHKITVQAVNCRVRSLRAFFNWLYRKGYTDTHLLQDVRPPRLPAVIVDTLSEEEIARIMSTQDQSTVLGSRNIAVLSVLFGVGLRLSKFVGLDTENVHIEEQYVKVMGKVVNNY